METSTRPCRAQSSHGSFKVNGQPTNSLDLLCSILVEVSVDLLVEDLVALVDVVDFTRLILPLLLLLGLTLAGKRQSLREAKAQAPTFRSSCQ